MTREELKLEAKEYADKYGKTNFDLWDTARFAYYQGAEPREKQIAELTKQNTSLLTSVENLNKSVQELEKENTELKAGRPQWHDLRKDPNDLPKATTPVLVILESGVPYVSWISSDKGWWFCTNYYTEEDKVIAWCEIPTFDKEKEQ